MPSSDSESGKRRRDPRHRLGQEYEQVAADFLRRQGFEILHSNYRTGHLEIDLVAQSEGLLVFVEVKAARSERAFGHPAEWIDGRKVERLTRAAQRYVAENDIGRRDLRFDVITFTEGKLEHYPDAFRAEES
jgi:putative endonuclease